MKRIFALMESKESKNAKGIEGVPVDNENVEAITANSSSLKQPERRIKDHGERLYLFNPAFVEFFE
jgi:hypothetical protein